MAKKEKKAKVQWCGIENCNDDMIQQIKNALINSEEPYSELQDRKMELKEIYEEVHASTGIPSRLLNFLVKDHYEHNAHQTLEKNKELEDFYNKMENV